MELSLGRLQVTSLLPNLFLHSYCLNLIVPPAVGAYASSLEYPPSFALEIQLYHGCLSNILSFIYILVLNAYLLFININSYIL